jgi:propanol-preferring alcohol dehydrogenase
MAALPIMSSPTPIYMAKPANAGDDDGIARLGIGHLQPLIDRHPGAEPVDVDDAKLDLARRLGAKVTVNARTEADPAAAIKREARRC